MIHEGDTPKIGPKVQLQTAFLVLCLEPETLYSCGRVAGLNGFSVKEQRGLPRVPHYERLRDSLSQFARSNSFCGYREAELRGRIKAANGRLVPAYAGSVWQDHVGSRTLQAALEIAAVLARPTVPDSGERPCFWSATTIARRSLAGAENTRELTLRVRLLCRLWRFWHGRVIDSDQQTAAEQWRLCLPDKTRRLALAWSTGNNQVRGLSPVRAALQAALIFEEPQMIPAATTLPVLLKPAGFLPAPSFKSNGVGLFALAALWVLALLGLGWWTQQPPDPGSWDQPTSAWASMRHEHRAGADCYRCFSQSENTVQHSMTREGSGRDEARREIRGALPTPFRNSSSTPAQPDLVLGFVPMSP